MREVSDPVSRQPSVARSYRRHRGLFALGIVGIYLLAVFAAFTWPAVLSPSTLYFRDGWNDIEIFLWNFWWVKEAILRGINPLWTDMLYHPTGLSLAYHTLTLPQDLIALPWVLAGEYLLAYNAVLLLGFVSTGILMATVCRLVTGSWLAGIFGGIYFVLLPNYMNRVAAGHLNLLSLQWSLGACLTWIAIMTTTSPRKGALAAVAMGLTSAAAIYTDLEQALFLPLILCLVHLGRFGLQLPRREQMMAGAVAVGLAGALLLPLAVPIVRDLPLVASTSPIYVASERALEYHSVDLLAPFIPTPYTDSGLVLYHRLLGLSATIQTKPAFLGFTALPLIALGVRHRKGLYILIPLTLPLVLALGPEIAVADMPVLHNFLFDLTWHTPILGMSRTPERFLVVVNVGVTMLAALGLSRLIGRLAVNATSTQARSHHLPSVLVGIITLMVTAEFLPTPKVEPLNPRPSPEILQAVQEGKNSAVLELPRNHGTIAVLRMEYHQIAHGMPLITGYASRPQIPNLDQSERLEPQIALSTLRYLGNSEEAILWQEEPSGVARLNGIDVPDRVKKVLGWFDIGYVLVDKEVMKETDVDKLRRKLNWVLGSAPVGEDPTFLLYRVDAPHQSLVADFGELWHAWEWNGQLAFRWSSGKSSLYVLSDQPRQVTMDFQVWSFEGSRTLSISMDNQVLSQIPIDPQMRTVTLRFTTHEGLNQLVLAASGEAYPERPGGRNLSFAITEPRIAAAQ